MPIIQIFGEGVEAWKKKKTEPMSQIPSKPWSSNKGSIETKCGKGAFGKLEAFPVVAGDPAKPLTVKFGPKCVPNKSLEQLGCGDAKFLFFTKKGVEAEKAWEPYVEAASPAGSPGGSPPASPKADAKPEAAPEPKAAEQKKPDPPPPAAAPPAAPPAPPPAPPAAAPAPPPPAPPPAAPPAAPAPAKAPPPPPTPGKTAPPPPPPPSGKAPPPPPAPGTPKVPPPPPGGGAGGGEADGEEKPSGAPPPPPAPAAKAPAPPAPPPPAVKKVPPPAPAPKKPQPPPQPSSAEDEEEEGGSAGARPPPRPPPPAPAKKLAPPAPAPRSPPAPPAPAAGGGGSPKPPPPAPRAEGGAGGATVPTGDRQLEQKVEEICKDLKALLCGRVLSSGGGSSSRTAEETFAPVGEALACIGLEKYAPQLKEAEFDYDSFLSVTPDELTQLGVTALGARKRILAETARLRASGGAMPPTGLQRSSSPTATMSNAAGAGGAADELRALRSAISSLQGAGASSWLPSCAEAYVRQRERQVQRAQQRELDIERRWEELRRLDPQAGRAADWDRRWEQTGGRASPQGGSLRQRLLMQRMNEMVEDCAPQPHGAPPPQGLGPRPAGSPRLWGAAGSPTYTGAAPPARAGSPQQWRSYRAPDGATYWHNPATGVTQWDPPGSPPRQAPPPPAAHQDTDATYWRWRDEYAAISPRHSPRAGYADTQRRRASPASDKRRRASPAARQPRPFYY
eukprot:TRINITY_DN18715_c0_g4_i1.p1 TRINITY_DN18715_c0_g4~~TRINITY_DN18715_c0_g4_i1.p1  ORF type:complete len:770 (+),score=197.74 TRINITY_DN18715_c0_g4_i1:107-2311(+)